MASVAAVQEPVKVSMSAVVYGKPLCRSEDREKTTRHETRHTLYKKGKSKYQTFNFSN